MLTFLNCGFGEPLSADDLALIKALGYKGIRNDVPSVTVAETLLDNALQGGLDIICVIPVAVENDCQSIAHALAGWTAMRGAQDRVVLEVGNEEDLAHKRWSGDPTGWAALVRDVESISAQHSPDKRILVVSGGVSSVSRQALDWLKRSNVRNLPVAVGYHQYRSTSPAVQLDGYRSREHEFAVLREAAGDRPIWCTECGWSTYPRKTGTWPFSKRWAYTDSQVAGFLTAEMQGNQAFGAEAFTVYQLNDADPPKSDQDRFGIRRTDGSLKPQAKILLA